MYFSCTYCLPWFYPGTYFLWRFSRLLMLIGYCFVFFVTSEHGRDGGWVRESAACGGSRGGRAQGGGGEGARSPRGHSGGRSSCGSRRRRRRSLHLCRPGRVSAFFAEETGALFPGTFFVCAGKITSPSSPCRFFFLSVYIMCVHDFCICVCPWCVCP